MLPISLCRYCPRFLSVPWMHQATERILRLALWPSLFTNLTPSQSFPRIGGADRCLRVLAVWGPEWTGRLPDRFGQ